MEDCHSQVNFEEKSLVCLHVKAVATEIDDYARRAANSVLRDSRMAPLLMESAVTVVSRFLMIHRAPLLRGTTKTLLRSSFRRGLQREAEKSNNREFWGGCNDVEEVMLAFVNSGQTHGCIDSERVVRLLSRSSRTILALRNLGYTWKEIGHLLSTGHRVAERRFREELQQALSIADHPEFRQVQLEMAKQRKRDEEAEKSVIPRASIFVRLKSILGPFELF